MGDEGANSNGGSGDMLSGRNFGKLGVLGVYLAHFHGGER